MVVVEKYQVYNQNQSHNKILQENASIYIKQYKLQGRRYNKRLQWGRTQLKGWIYLEVIKCS